jgi:hypothetical protein
MWLLPWSSAIPPELPEDLPPLVLPTQSHNQLKKILTRSELTYFEANNDTQQFSVRLAATAKRIWEIRPAHAHRDRLWVFLQTIVEFLITNSPDCDSSQHALKMAFTDFFHGLCVNGTSHTYDEFWGLNMIIYSQEVVVNPFLPAEYDPWMLSLHSLNGIFFMRFVDRAASTVPQHRTKPATPIHQALFELVTGSHGRTHKIIDAAHRYSDHAGEFGRFYNMIQNSNKAMNDKACNILLWDDSENGDLYQDDTFEEHNSSKPTDNRLSGM